jgi:cell shape-determining protein MreC
MKQEALKSKTDPRKLLVFSFISAFLLVTNITGWNRAIYASIDEVLNPFLIVGHNVALNSNLLMREITNKSTVLKENIDLRRQISSYDELRAENKDLKDQIARLQSQTGIEGAERRELQLVKVTGAQNLYTSTPELMVYLDGVDDVERWDVVYYDQQTLFGFVKEVDGKTAKVVPFYSPEIKFNIPVQSVRDSSQKGFVSPISNAKVGIRNVPREIGVSSGDTWITTNDVTEVPPSMYIGRVSFVQKDTQENFQRIEIDVPFSLSTTTYLMIEK